MEIFLQSHKDVLWIGLCSFFKLQELCSLALFKNLQIISIKSFKNFGSMYYCLPSLQNQCVPKSSILVYGKNIIIILEFFFTLNSFTMSTTTMIPIFTSICLGTCDFFHWVIFYRCGSYLVQMMLLDVMTPWKHIY
jgi:hypothetical protein